MVSPLWRHEREHPRSEDPFLETDRTRPAGRGDRDRQGGTAGGKARSDRKAEWSEEARFRQREVLDVGRFRRPDPGAREVLQVKLLLDTHAFLWWIGDDPRLSA